MQESITTIANDLIGFHHIQFGLLDFSLSLNISSRSKISIQRRQGSSFILVLAHYFIFSLDLNFSPYSWFALYQFLSYAFNREKNRLAFWCSFCGTRHFRCLFYPFAVWLCFGISKGDPLLFAYP